MQDAKVPGVVLLRQLFSLQEQLELIQLVQEKGGLHGKDGGPNFYQLGRSFCNIAKYSDCKLMQACFKRFKDAAEAKDKTIKWPDVTHVLTYRYPGKKGMPWHKDGYGENNGDVGAPVYSLSLGNTCIFEYKLVGGDGAVTSVELQSGDGIVFGGSQREMYHRVASVMPGTWKHLHGFDARINLTGRTCTGFTEEDEACYQTDVYFERVKEQKKNK